MYGIDHYHVIVTIPVQTTISIVITQRLLSRPYSIPAQFDVNTN